MLPANEVEAMTDNAAASMIFFIIFSYIFRLDLSIPIDRMALVDLEPSISVIFQFIQVNFGLSSVQVLNTIK